VSVKINVLASNL